MILVILIAMMTIITVLISINVVTRYIWHFSITWNEEITRFMFIWSVLFGTSLGIKRRNHFNLNIVSNLISIKYLDLFVSICILLFSLVMIIEGFKLATRTFTQLSPSLSIPMGYIYLAIPLTGLFNVIFTINNMLRPLSHQEEK
ncbi:TRAP transporter small permease [Neomoorella mulderi]